MKKLAMTALICASGFMATAAQAATWTTYAPPPDFTGLDPAATAIYETKNKAQSAGELLPLINGGDFDDGFNVDDAVSVGSTCDKQLNCGLTSGTFNLATVHFGKSNQDSDLNNVLLFYWSTAISSFSFESFKGISGVNLYSFEGGGGNQNEVPLPGAIWLLGSALLGFVGLSRRKNASV